MTNAARARTADLWEDVGPFLYRELPEMSLDAFFGDERDMVQISHSLGKWWVAETGVMGETPHETLEQAKTDGDRRIAEAESKQDAQLLDEAGLDPATWAVCYRESLTFVDAQGDRAIVAETDELRNEQRWDAFSGDDAVASGVYGVAEALAAFDAPANTE